jgi:hypothetical protein
MIELSNSKTTRLGKRRSRCACFIGAVQMNDNGWVDIEPQLIRNHNGWKLVGAPYYAEVKDNGERIFYPDKYDRTDYFRIPAQPLFSPEKNIAYGRNKITKTPVPNFITMSYDWGRLDYVFANTGMRFQAHFTKRPPKALFGESMKFLINIDSNLDINKALRSKKGIGIRKPRLYSEQRLKGTDLQREERFFNWSYNHSQMELGFDFGTLPFPITFSNSSFDVQVEASADDGDEESDVITYDGTYFQIFAYPGSIQRHGLWRFQNVTVPKDATINAGTYLYLYYYDKDDFNHEIYCNLVADANNLADEADIDGRARTTSHTTWADTNVGTGWEASPDIDDEFQEVVNQGSWSSGNAVAVMMIGNDAPIAAAYVIAEDYSDGSLAGQLFVDYTEGAAGWGGEFSGVSVSEIDGVTPDEIDGV